MLSIGFHFIAILSLALIFGQTYCEDLTEEELRYNDWNCRANLINMVDSFETVIESYHNKSGDVCHIYCRVRKIGRIVTEPPKYYEMNMPNYKLCGFLKMCLAGQCIGWSTPRIRPMRMVARGIYRMRQLRNRLYKINQYFDNDPNIRALQIALEDENFPIDSIKIEPRPTVTSAPQRYYPLPTAPAVWSTSRPQAPPVTAVPIAAKPTTENLNDDLGLAQFFQNIGQPVPPTG